MVTIDYPLVFDDMRVRGMTYIKDYLEHLAIETAYCTLFSIEDINRLLYDFGRLCRLVHRIELVKRIDYMEVDFY